MIDIANNIASVKARVQRACNNSSRNVESVQLLAVSKTKSAELIAQAYALGLREFGENYAQELEQKSTQLSELNINWHFIGPIQSNKTALIAKHANWVHSIDRLKIAKRLAEQRPHHLPPMQVLIQVNIDDEDTKSGVTLNELPELALAVNQLENIELRGLMAIPQANPEADAQQQSFLRLAAAFAELKSKYTQIDTLSVGMSRDLEAAIAGGSTMVRIGTDIFGSRD